MDCHHSTAAAAAAAAELLVQTWDPVADKLVDMNVRLDELLLQLSELKDYMPEAADVENLGKPRKTVKLRGPTKSADNTTKPAMQKNHNHNHQSDPLNVIRKAPRSSRYDRTRPLPTFRLPAMVGASYSLIAMEIAFD